MQRIFTADVVEIAGLRNTRDGGRRFRVSWTDGTADTKGDAQVNSMIYEGRTGRYEITLNSQGHIIGMKQV